LCNDGRVEYSCCLKKDKVHVVVKTKMIDVKQVIQVKRRNDVIGNSEMIVLKNGGEPAWYFSNCFEPERKNSNIEFVGR
jgi:hypothetical protein